MYLISGNPQPLPAEAPERSEREPIVRVVLRCTDCEYSWLSPVLEGEIPDCPRCGKPGERG